MKDEEIEAKARGLVLGRLHYEDTEDDDEAVVRIVAAALRTARNEAIEEAAKVCDEDYRLVDGTGKRLAKAIRSLSSHPAGGHDV